MPSKGKSGAIQKFNAIMSTVQTTENKAPKLSKETVGAMEELGTVLKAIYIRMKRDGYVIVEGKMVKINENE